MTLSGYFTSKSVFDQQGCHALTVALAIGFPVGLHTVIQKN